MKNMAIYYFSGTGNTKKITEDFQKEMEFRRVQVDLFPIEKVIQSKEKINLSAYQMIGIAYPIYGFGTPLIVQNFLRTLPHGEGKKLFIFKSAADFISLNHNASTKVIKELEEKDYTLFYDRIIVMPSNWLIGYKDAINQQLYSCAKEKVIHMCDEILKEKERRYHPGWFLKILTNTIAKLENYGTKYFGKSLRTNDSCNLCGLCSKKCPVGNIVQDATNIYFKDHCISCMRCIYSCPKGAIKSKGYGFCILKEGYDLDKLLKKKTNIGEYISKRTTGYFKHFYRYISDIAL